MYRLGVRTLVLLFVNFGKKNLDGWQRQAADEGSPQPLLDYGNAPRDEGLRDYVAVSHDPGLVSLVEREKLTCSANFLVLVRRDAGSVVAHGGCCVELVDCCCGYRSVGVVGEVKLGKRCTLQGSEVRLIRYAG